MTTTKTLGKSITTTISEGEDIMILIAALFHDGEMMDDTFITSIKLGAWYGDPYIRSLTVSATWMGVSVLLEEEGRWTVTTDLPLTKCTYLRTGDGDLRDVTDMDADELEELMNGDACLIPAGSTTRQAIYNEAANLGWSKHECDELIACEF